MPRNTGPVTRALLALVTALTLTACSSGPPKPQVDYKQDYSFGQVRKIAFFKYSGQVTGENPIRVSDIQRNRVDEALQQALEKRGYQFVDDPKQADLMLSWHLATQDKTDVRTYQSPAYGYGYGYGRYNRYARYNCWSCMPTQTEVSVQEYTEGTFIVDMIDPNLNQSVWRGVTQSKLKPDPDREGQQERLNAAADVIFESFPPN